MIPRTFPSTFAANGQQQMVVYTLPSITGLTAWIDYIPVKGVTTESATLENTYANVGYQVVDSLASLTGKQAWLDYIPVYEDASYTKPWSTDAGGYIPTSALAALLLDFTSGRLDPRITFSRTTNATLTNSAGVVANAPMNLLTFSEQFDNAYWSKIEATVSANQIASPDGTFTADKILTTTANNVHVVFKQTVVSTGTVTLSVYAKAGEYSWLFMSDTNSTGNGANFNLATGVLGTVGSNATATITPAGNGWYRCTVTTTASAGSGMGLYVQNANNAISFVGNATSGLYIWGAQLEIGSTATTYNPTTVKNLLGFTENFDNAAWTKSNAFVQTNLLTYSEDFSQTAWGKANITLTPNATASPTGAVTAQRLAATTTAATSVTQDQVVNATSATFTVYAKQDSGATDMNTFIVRNVTTSTNLLNITVNYSTGAVTYITGSSGALMQDDGNGWWRIQLAVSSGITSGNTLRPYVGASGASVPAGQSAFFWGAQLVQGTTPGDYKATYAAAAAVGYTDIYGQPFAQKLVENTAAGAHLVQQAFSAGAAPTTATCYMKAAERSIGYLRIFDNIAGAGYATYFDLATGTVLTNASGNTATITSLGNGFWRCSVTRQITGISTSHLAQAGCTTADNTLSYTGDGTSGIYIFGAQLADSASVDPYVYQPVAAPSSVAYYGPRFDYDPVTLAPKGLLIEEQRTNLLLRSEEFDNAAWIAVAVAGVGANTAVAPSGSTTADTVIPNTANATHYVYQTINLTSGTSYTMTVYAKPAGYNRFMIRESTTAGYFAAFDVASGTVVNTSGATGTISAVGNGWYRCSMTMTAPATVATVMSIIGMNNTGTTYADATFIGNGTSGLFLWGAQLEAGAFATSYIPTVASQVTRAADSASMIGNNFARWYNQTEGTVYTQADVSVPSSAVNSGVFALGSTTSDIMRIFRQTDAQPVAQVITGGAAQATMGMGASWTTTAAQKIAFAYATNNFSATANGGTTITDTSGTVPIVSQAVLGNAAGIGALNGHLVRVAFYSRVLASSEQKGITS